MENYFRGTGALVGDYWHGTNRSDSNAPYFYFNGTQVSPNNSNSNPYVHWSWYHFSFRNGAGYDCTLCWGDLKYDSYNGDSSLAQQGSSTYYQTTTGYLKYGWTAFKCTDTAHYVCQYPADIFPLFPPPNPPSPPLLPPSPPNPPAPPNCAPPYNSTFFCDATASNCYSYMTNPANFSTARASCMALNGHLVKYDNAGLQYDVEQYLNRTGALSPYYYWIGISRANENETYQFIDGSGVPQIATNVPYAHWSWKQSVAASQKNYHCVIAQGQFAYDTYLGGDGAKQQSSITYYTVNDPIFVANKYGWNAQACNATYPYVCQIPIAGFTCYPPPSPNPPPPAPPPPPMPPAPLTGVLATGRAALVQCLCNGQCIHVY